MNKIPKIIHYCWFGGNPLPKQAKKCIESWKKFCPDYEIVEWNESNFDIHCCMYVEEAYEAKKWAFVVDYVRFSVLFQQGGIYLETDTELIKPLDDLLNHNAFFGFGRETMTLPCFGCVKGALVAENVMAVYRNRKFKEKNGYNLTTVNQTLFDVLTEQYGLIHNNQFQVLREDVAVYPKEYFFSTDWTTGIITKNPNLYVIHYADGSWMTDEQKMQYRIQRTSIKFFGKRIGGIIGDFVFLLRRDGVESIVQHGNRYIKRTTQPIFMKIANHLFFKKKKIIFENFAGKGYGDNPKYIAEEMIRQELGYDMVWIVKPGTNYTFPKQIRTVETGTWKEIFELATAGFWVDNNRKSASLYKGKNQHYIQTWHGFYPLKKIEKDAEKSLTKGYIASAKHDGAMTDLMVSGCGTRTKLYQTSFWYNGEILECGTPRNDIFFDGKDYRRLIQEYFHIDLSKKILLYAPTFRDNHSIGAYNIDFKRLLNNMEKRFGGEWVCLVRLHPAVRDRSKELSFSDNCIDASSYDDIQELFCASDFMITDYSNCMFEFLLTKRPVVLYASDIDGYTEARDFYYDIHELPFEIVENNDELETAILQFDSDAYDERITQFFNKMNCFENGRASKAVVEYILKNT